MSKINSSSEISLEAYYERVVLDPFFAFVVMPDGQLVQLENMPSTRTLDIVPGSFNPLHEAHEAIYKACKEPESMIMYEISVRRLGKNDLTLEELKERLAQFTWKAAILVTNAPYFLEKCGLMSNFEKKPNFHIGHDTAKRIVDIHGVLGSQGIFANFFVYDRIEDGKQTSIKDWKVKPKNFAHGKMDSPPLAISSTEIRNKKSDKKL